MNHPFDAIIVGARCAGSPAAMLLARSGHRVLLVDRATFPSDTVSSHIVHPPGVAALGSWGILDSLLATGCPPIHTYSYDLVPVTIRGSPGTLECPVGYCPRRTVLDHLLLAAAARAGAEVREGFTVEELVTEGGRVVGVKGRSRGGAAVTERARVVIGADGQRSLVAECVRAEQYGAKPPLNAAYYSYWSGLPMDGQLEVHFRPGRGFGAAPTHDGLTMIIGGWPYCEFEANKKDIEGHFRRLIEIAPEFAERVRGATREARFAGVPLPNFFRKPYGPGWALVGDAGYLKDSITAQGISDAFRDAERCAQALDEFFSGTRPYDDAMADYQGDRDRHVLPMYELTCQLATLEPPPPEMQQLFATIQGNQPAMDAFVRMNAGTISPAEFFAPGNVRAMLSSGPSSRPTSAEPRPG